MAETAPRSQLVALIVAAALFMELLDAHIIAIALPAMAKSFRTDPVLLTIGITSYLMTLAVVIPASGWLADRFGVRTIFATAIAGFTLASLLCGMSENIYQFTAARIFQGASAALMSPVGRLAVIATASKQELIRMIALITWPALLAPVIGPPLGGFLVSTLSWRWIFFVNLPIGLAGIALALVFVPNLRSEQRRRFDLIGFALSAVALACLIAAVELAGHGGAAWQYIAALSAAGALAGVGAIKYISRRSDRLVDLTTFKVKTFSATTLTGGLLFRLTGGAMPYLLPLFFQIGFELDAFTAGLMVFAYAFGNIAMKIVTTPTLRRFGFRRVLIVNGLLTAVSIFACVGLTPSMPVLTVGVLFLAGCFRSMQFTSINTLTFADIASSQRSSATTLSAMFQQLAVGLGIAIAAMVLNISSSARGPAEALSIVDFHIAFVVIGSVALIGTIRFLLLDKNAGAEVSGHRRGG